MRPQHRVTEVRRVRAESCLQDAFVTDVRDAVGVWRKSRGRPLDPQKRFVKPVTSSALRKSARGARQQVLSHTPDPRSRKQLHPKDLSNRCG